MQVMDLSGKEETPILMQIGVIFVKPGERLSAE
jgi:hypothetical protein